jgi:hypothetical protein
VEGHRALQQLIQYTNSLPERQTGENAVRAIRRPDRIHAFRAAKIPIVGSDDFHRSFHSASGNVENSACFSHGEAASGIEWLANQPNPGAV